MSTLGLITLFTGLSGLLSALAAGFFLLLGLGTLYSPAPLPEAWRAWFKYREILYLPLFLLRPASSFAA